MTEEGQNERAKNEWHITRKEMNRRGERYRDYPSSRGFIVICDGNGKPVCSMLTHTSPVRWMQDVENAALITNAPKLKAALVECLTYVQSVPELRDGVLAKGILKTLDEASEAVEVRE